MGTPMAGEGWVRLATLKLWWGHIYTGQVKLDQHYVDPRLVALYDRDNPRGDDTDFYLQLAIHLGARVILDLGCGTGLLTRAFATNGRDVRGIDPASAMLAWARQQPGAEHVQWTHGDASILGTPNADLAVMTGNVAQVFLDDEVWDTTLKHLYAALRPGGHLAFESRNPEVREWESWHPYATYEEMDTPFGRLTCWLDAAVAEQGRVHFTAHNVFADTGEDLVVDSTLRFRSRVEIAQALARAGFTVVHEYGNWQGGVLTPASRVMIFVARRDENTPHE